MGEPELAFTLRSEAELVEAAGEIALSWRADGCGPLLIGLRGELGSGKTSWVRAMLRGLGYEARVPSPTYTLLEQYSIGGLVLVHMDLYRLTAGEELENLGVRDWLARRDAWLLVEWPERASRLLARCDVLLDFKITGESSRRLELEAASSAGRAALESIHDLDSKYSG